MIYELSAVQAWSLGQWALMRWWHAQPQRDVLYAYLHISIISSLYLHILVAATCVIFPAIANAIHCICKWRQVAGEWWHALVWRKLVKKGRRGMWNGVLLVELWPRVFVGELCKPFPSSIIDDCRFRWNICFGLAYWRTLLLLRLHEFLSSFTSGYSSRKLQQKFMASTHTHTAY